MSRIKSYSDFRRDANRRDELTNSLKFRCVICRKQSRPARDISKAVIKFLGCDEPKLQSSHYFIWAYEIAETQAGRKRVKTARWLCFGCHQSMDLFRWKRFIKGRTIQRGLPAPLHTTPINYQMSALWTMAKVLEHRRVGR